MMSVLKRALSQVRAKIHRARVSPHSADRQLFDDTTIVKSQLVDPILSALGWSIDNEDEVRADLRSDDSASRVALFQSGVPCFFVEVRPLGTEPDNKLILETLLPRVGDSGFPWLVLTDGDDYSVFSARAGVPGESRTFDAVQISVDSTGDALEFFSLLSNDQVAKNRIESQWKCRVVDRQVRASLSDLLAPDAALVQLLLQKTKDLSAGDIRSSLERTTVDFRTEYHGGPDSGPDVTEQGSKRSTGMSDAELHVATWLQQRSIERWAKGAVTQSRTRESQRRVVEHRRGEHDRRTGVDDRRLVRLERAEERRNGQDRRCRERRENGERRVTTDRRLHFFQM